MPGLEIALALVPIVLTMLGTTWYLATLIGGLKKDVESLAKRVSSHKRKTHRLSKRVDQIEATLLKREIRA